MSQFSITREAAGYSPDGAQRGLLATLLERDRALTVFGLAMWAAMIPALAALGLDERELRGVSVWAKPLKFLAAIGLYALTMAWFMGYVEPLRRRSPMLRAIAGTAIATGGFEIAYITLQAALGAGSHYNVDTRLHAAMYSLMGIGALLLTATSALLAREVHRHPAPGLDPVLRDAAVLGLGLTFVLGAGVGMVLGGMQPPAGAGLPVLGWSTVAGDLRPAHFFGVHAQQLIPALGLVALLVAPGHARTLLRVGTIAYALFTVLVFAQALAGRPFVAL